MSETASQIVERMICERRTVKVMSEQPQPVTESQTRWQELLETARWAPFSQTGSCVSFDRGKFSDRDYALEILCSGSRFLQEPA